MKINWKLLYSDIDCLRTTGSSQSWRDLATRWELPPSTFTRLSLGKAVRAETLLFLVAKVNRPDGAGRYVLKAKRVVK